MQKARRSSIQSTKTYKASRHSSRKTLHRHSSSIRTFQTFQSFMIFQPYKHYYTFQHLPVQSSTFQCYPVLSSAIQCIQGFHPFQHFFNQNANSTHRLVSTRNSIEYQSNTRQYITTNFHSSKKGRCCDIGHYSTE